MKIKKVILTALLMQFITGVLCSPVFAVYPGTFDYNNETAYIIERPKQGKEILLYVDFKNETNELINPKIVIKICTAKYMQQISRKLPSCIQKTT
ncbi:hypothetical protein MNBD_GAMMA08-1156 [hydrothermal vent metagenome]|uniref:Uncharacterized protein n=1 Tax=hydrothermal vent metagenome TaxID=652676 RepID=A0A3B0XIT5_9ZZZZ